MDPRSILIIPVFFPFAAGLVIYGAGKLRKRKYGEEKETDETAVNPEKVLNWPAVVLAAAEFAAVLWMVIRALQGSGAELQIRQFTFEMPGVCGLGLSFTLDGFRALFGLIAAYMWTMATVFSGDYFAGHRNVERFYLFLFWTLGATMGVFLSADLFTTFLFFEMMSFTSYVWVAQEENRPALRAAETYLAVAVTGGMVMLMGLFLLYHRLGTLVIDQLPAAAYACGDKKVLYAAGGCLLFGFGAKAGAFPLHIWLPKAHPAAPAPASALLSGILTKTGIYGILIVSCGMFRQDPEWGSILLLLGCVTMLGGALLAVFSVDLKRTLACSSMSQIGFILTGIAMQGLLREENALAVHGTFLHMANHSLIKLVLFMAAGVVYMNTHSLDLNVIRGWGRKKPLLAGIFLTGALAIGGIPLFGGYISKTLLHESILEYSGPIRGVEAVFLFSGGLTVAYMTKLFAAIFVEKNNDDKVQQKYDGQKKYMGPAGTFALSLSGLLLLVWGLFPHSVMDRAARMAQSFMGLTEVPGKVAYFDPENLKGALISIAVGAVVYVFFIRKVLLRRQEEAAAAERGMNAGTGQTSREKVYVNLWPKWLDLEEMLYRPLFLGLLPGLFRFLCRIPDSLVDTAVVVLRKTLYRDSPLPHERPEGNVFTAAAGHVLNAIQRLGNHTWNRQAPISRDYVHLAAMKGEEIRENNTIIRRSLSFGLMLFAIGLSLTLVYLILM